MNCKQNINKISKFVIKKLGIKLKDTKHTQLVFEDEMDEDELKNIDEDIN